MHTLHPCEDRLFGALFCLLSEVLSPLSSTARGRRTVISLAHAIDAGYTQQSVAPYHNNIHGADVIQALNYFIRSHLHERLVGICDT